MYDSAPPKQFDHCVKVFSAMRRQATSVQVGDGGDTRHALVYEGFTTKLFQDLGLPTPYYTWVMRNLRSMHCVLQLSRGGGGTPSRWELLEDPTIEKFEAAQSARREAPTRLELIEGGLRAVNGRVSTLESQVETLLELAKNQEAASG